LPIVFQCKGQHAVFMQSPQLHLGLTIICILDRTSPGPAEEALDAQWNPIQLDRFPHALVPSLYVSLCHSPFLLPPGGTDRYRDVD
jgi:hypothetical protein